MGGRRDRIVALVDDFLLPRLDDPGRPLDVVFVGPTGSGKSTLVNSLGRRQISETGVLRPTTSQPVALVSENRSAGFEDLYGVQCEVVEGDAPVLDLMTFIDTPDIDSTAIEHSRIAERLVDNADVVVLVVSAARYADHLPWQMMRRAISRGATVIPLLNRVSARTVVAVSDLERRLRDEGLEEEVVVVGEHVSDLRRQRLPALSVQTLARRLATIASQVSSEREAIWDRALRLTSAETEGLLRDLRRDNYQILTDRKERESTLRLLASQLVFDPNLAVGALPSKRGRAETRRWSAELRRRFGDLDGLRSHVTRYVHDVVTSAVSRYRVSHPESPIQDLDERDFEALGVDSWLEFTSRILDSGIRPVRIAPYATLVVGGLSLSDDPAWAELLGDDWDEMVHRSRRDLRAKLDGFFGGLAARTSDGESNRDPVEVELALSGVVAPQPHVDA